MPHRVYGHAWVEIVDGTIEPVRRRDDLSNVGGDPAILFHGSDAPWARPLKRRHDGYVTDGPFLFQTKETYPCQIIKPTEPHSFFSC